MYTVVAHTDAKGIRAVRLELLTDDSLPSKGPGRAPNGNLVLTRFLVTAAPKANPASSSQGEARAPKADFEQSGFPARNAIDSDEQGDPTGWAIAPQFGVPHGAIFYVDSPRRRRRRHGADVRHGPPVRPAARRRQVPPVGEHRPGRGRRARGPRAHRRRSPKTAADKRTPEQKAQIAGVLPRNVDPQVAADRARLDALRTLVAPQAEMARLEAVLKEQTPQLDAEMAQWERRVLAGSSWTPLDFSEMKSDGGATFSKEPDGSVVVGGTSAPTDTYKLTATSPLRGVTAVRLEVLPDPRLPDNGPGRGAGGNFILDALRPGDGAEGEPGAGDAGRAALAAGVGRAAGVVGRRRAGRPQRHRLGRRRLRRAARRWRRFTPGRRCPAATRTS